MWLHLLIGNCHVIHFHVQNKIIFLDRIILNIEEARVVPPRLLIMETWHNFWEEQQYLRLYLPIMILRENYSSHFWNWTWKSPPERSWNFRWLNQNTGYQPLIAGKFICHHKSCYIYKVVVHYVLDSSFIKLKITSHKTSHGCLVSYFSETALQVSLMFKGWYFTLIKEHHSLQAHKITYFHQCIKVEYSFLNFANATKLFFFLVYLDY